LFAAARSHGDPEPADALDVQVAPRTVFKVPLARINIAYDNERKKYNRVRIYFDETEAHSVIAPDDDTQVRRNGEATVFRELPGRTYKIGRASCRERVLLRV
jgi:hypothetical protein